MRHLRLQTTSALARLSAPALATLILLPAGLAGCGSDADVIDAGESTLPQIVPLGKEDNYLAPKAQEYIVEGRTTVTLDEADAQGTDEERLAAARRLIPYKQVVIGWFLNSWIVSKSSKSENKEYGDFHALTKNGSYAEMDIRALDERTYEFTFRQEVGGPLNLLDKMPTETDANGLYTDLVIGKISNRDMQKLETNNEWYRKSPWGTFDPSKVSEDRKETVRLYLKAQPRSIDAWLDYERLFADGRVTVGVHFGWDYHNEYHIKHSRSVYQWLTSHGYRSPVSDYDSYTRTSGPLTRTITANGRPVDIEVSLYWGKPGTDTDPDTDSGGIQLEKDMIESLESRDVIVYSGHSGPFYGFALGNWKKTAEGDLDDAEIPGLNLPRDYQIVLAEGCETYALGQAFWDNPAKGDRTNLDIITTTSFSNASTSAAVTDFLTAIAGTGWNDDVHQPKTWGDLLEDLDRNSSWFSTMYGVHGIDDNPHLHPWADATAFCSSCDRDSDCGAEGNFCADLGTATGGSRGICTAACTADTGCPDGFTCAAVASGQAITGRACVPLNLNCEMPSTETSPLLVSEIVATTDQDLNGDGVVDGGDQFVELVNVSDLGLSLGGFTIADGQMVRARLPEVIVAPGERVVIFAAAPQAPIEGALVLAAELDLDAGGDSLTLRSDDGRVLDEVSWGHEGGQNLPLVRSELTPGAPLDLGSTPTPGV